MKRSRMGVANLQEVHILHHVHENEFEREDIKLLEIFYTEKTLETIKKYNQLEGFY